MSAFFQLIMADCNTVPSSVGTIMSPNYPNNYTNNLNVCWLINGNSNTYVRVSFPILNTEKDYDFVRVYGGDSINSPLLLEASGQYDSNYYAGYYGLTAVSPTNQMRVVFTSNSVNTYPGFIASFSSCTVLTSNSGNISSPNYPNDYNNMDSVCWVIRGRADYVIQLTINNLVTEQNCDFVRVFDGDSTHSPVLLNESGKPSWQSLTVPSSSNKMLVVFTSNANVVFKGFQANYDSVPSSAAIPILYDYSLLLAVLFHVVTCCMKRNSPCYASFLL